VAAPALPDFAAFGQVRRESMSAVRAATAEAMARAWTTVPQVTQFDTADATELEALRKRYGPAVEKAGAKLTVTAILLKIAAGALRRFPQVNASVDMGRHEIVYKQYYHLGVAVDTDRGLVVPVIRDVDRKNIVELAVELGEAAARARDRKLKMEDMQGGTFTVSNLGGLGGKHFAPIINYPEVAILGVGRASIQPTYVDGELKPRLMLPLALSYDHRLVDGADGTRFLRWIVEAVEQPFLLSLEG
jgi:pyruvate dehydrogenase E2 component (dihydrolipoamide acetyltransferase)